jgi:hypothetical protein
MRLSKDHCDDAISDMTFAWIEGALKLMTLNGAQRSS